MKSIRQAHVVVVVDSDHGLVLAARLRRMQVARVTAVGGVEEARRLCQTGGTDACIVVFDEAVTDAAPFAENDAPGRRCGVPSLMVAYTVTPFLRKVARRRGYCAAVPAALPPQMFYRRIRAALQQRRAARRVNRLPGVAFGGRLAPGFLEFGKPTLH
jgi:hypothetical protein